MAYMTLMLHGYGLLKWSHSALEHINCILFSTKSRICKNTYYSNNEFDTGDLYRKEIQLGRISLLVYSRARTSIPRNLIAIFLSFLLLPI